MNILAMTWPDAFVPVGVAWAVAFAAYAFFRSCGGGWDKK